MAKDTTKFSKGAGETSAGTIAVLDLSTLEDDLFPDLDMGTSDASNFSKFVSGFKSGFMDNFKTTQIVRNFASNALPTGFSRLIGSYDSLMMDVKDVAASVEKTNPRDLHYIANKVNRLLPSVKDYVPEGLYNLASSQLEQSVEKYDYLAKEQVAEFRKRRSHESGEHARQQRLEQREKEVREALDHGSIVAKDIFNRSEQAEAKREARRMVSEGIRDNVDKSRFDFLAKTASLSADSLTRMASYNEQVDFGIKKKGLELQLRTLLEIKDLTHLQRESLKLHDEAYKAIVRNTALPDHMKKDFNKLSKVGTGTAFAGKVKGAVGQSLSSYLFGYRGNLKKNAQKTLGRRLGELVNLARQGDQAAALGLKDLWNSRYETAGGFAGEGAANFLTNYIVPEVGQRLRPELERFGDQYLGGKQHKTAYLLDNVPSLLREFASSPRESGVGGFFKNQARDFLDPLLPVFGRNTKIDQGGLSNISEMAAFNEMTQRSIVDVIPGYLSRILQEIRILRTGDEDIDREVYDVTEGKFTGFKTYSKNLMNRLITPGEIGYTSSSIAKLLVELDDEGLLSDKAQDALSTKLLREAGQNKAFNPESFLTRSNTEGIDQETLEEIQKFFRSKFKFTDKGKMIENTENLKKRQELSELFNDLKTSVSDPSELIFKLIESGNTEMLRELGIITTRGGQDYLDYERIWSIQASDVRSQAKDARHYKNLFGRFRYSDEEQDEVDRKERRKARRDKWLGKGKALIGSDVNAVVEALKGKGGWSTDLKNSASDWTTGFKAPGNLGGWSPNVPGVAGIETNLANLTNRFKIADIFGKDRSTPLIKASDIEQGTLFDYESGKVIESYSDIKGPVVNSEGLMVISNLDIAQGLYTQTGQKLDLTPKTHESPFLAKAQQFTPGYADTAGTAFDNNSVDWYTQESTEPVITSAKLKAGLYYDDRGQVLTDVNKISGAVYDNEGNQVVTEEDYRKGLWNKRTNRKLSPADKALRRASGVVGALDTFFKTDTNTLIIRGFERLARVALGTGIEAFNSAGINRDAYLPEQSEPILTAAALKEGHYLSHKGKVIESFTLHKGPVYDIQGNLLVSEEQAPELMNLDGSKHAIASNYGVIGTVRRWGKKYVNWSKGYFKRAARKSFNFWKGVTSKIPFLGKLYNTGEIALRRAAGDFSDVKVPNFDAYLDGKPEPVLTRKALIDGQYFNAEGDVIKHFHQHRGEIYDVEGNLLVNKEELKRLKNPDGSKHILTKGTSLIGRTIGAIGRQMGRNLRTSGKLLKGVAKHIPILGRMFRSKNLPAATILARAQTQGQEISTESTLLASILDTLRAQAPEKLRKGSWQEQAQRLKDKASELSGKDSEAKGMDNLTKGIFGTITKGLGGLFGLGKDKDEEDDGDDYGVDDLARDALLGEAAMGGRKRRRRGKKPKIPKGKLGRFATRAGALTRAIPFVGPALATVGGFAGKAAMVAAGLLSIKAVAIGAAVAGVAYGGWKAYKYVEARKRIAGDFKQLRLLQYGFDSTIEKAKIVDLEDHLEKFTNKSANSQLIVSPDAMMNMAKLFGIDLKKESNLPQIQALNDFITKRLKPVYLGYTNTLESLGFGNIKLSEIDEKVPEDRKVELLEALEAVESTFNLEEPVRNPFSKKGMLEVSLKDIENQKALIRKNVEKKAKIKSASEGIPLDELKPLSAGLALNKATKPIDTEAVETPRKQTFGDAVRVDRAKKLATTTMPLAAPVVGGSAVVMGKFNTKGKVPGISAIRLRAYGAEQFDEATIYALIGLESQCLPYLHVGQGGKVDVSKSYHLICEKAKWLLGSKANDVRFEEWLRERFIPTLTTYYAVCTEMGYDPNKTNTFKDTAKVKIMAERIMGAVDEYGNSVWDAYNVFQSKLGNHAIRQLAEMELAELEKQDKHPVPSEGVNATKQQSLLNRGYEAFKDLAQSVGEKAKSIGSFIGNTAKSAASAVGSFATRAASAVGNIFSGGGNTGGGGPVGVMGTPIEVSFTEGNGGDWETIPKPAANKSAAAARPVFEAVGKMTGVDPLALHVFAGIESTFDYLAKAPTSTATGWFQFINATWDEMIAKYSNRFGLPPDTKDRKLRLDPRINALMGAMFLAENRNYLRTRIGREPTLVDLYCAHFMGAGGASNFLRTMARNPNVVGATAMPKEAAANKWIFYAKGNPLTFVQIYNSFTAKVNQFVKTFDKNYSERDEIKDQNEEKVVTNQEHEIEGPLPEDSESKAGSEAPMDTSLKQVAQDNQTSPDAMSVPSTGATTVNNTPPSNESSDSDTPVENVLDTVAPASKAEVAARRDQVRGQSVLESSRELMSLIDIQSKQLEAVVGIRADLAELLSLKRNSDKTPSGSSNVPKGMTSRNLGSYDGLMPT